MSTGDPPKQGVICRKRADARLRKHLEYPSHPPKSTRIPTIAQSAAPPDQGSIGGAIKLVITLDAQSPRPRFALGLGIKIKRHCSAKNILQSRLIDLLALVDVDGSPDIPLEAGVE